MSITNNKSSLQKKVSTTLVFGIAAFVVLSFVILHAVIAPAFDELELSAARTDLVRAERAIVNDVENLEAISADWALWDDIYDYLAGRNPAFAETNLERPTLTNLGLDMMALYSADRRLDWSDIVVDGKGLAASELAILDSASTEFETLLSPGSSASGISGLVATKFGPMLISSRPVLRSESTGPATGTLIMGQFLNADRLDRLRERTEVMVHTYGLEEFDVLYDVSDAQAVLAGNVTHLSQEDSIASFKVIPDIFGNQLLVLNTATPRDISALGAKTVNMSLLYLGIAGLILAIAVWLLLNSSIVRPMARLAAHMDDVRESGDLTRNLEMGRDDEIGALALQFDELTSAVNDARQALLDQSFKAGKADTAAEVLHNIRNAMTPMTNGIERLARSLIVGETLRVPEATAELVDPDCAPERKDKLLQYINVSFQRMAEMGDESAADLKLVSSQARQIEGILSDQEKFANVAPVTENIPVAEVLDEATHVIPRDTNLELEVASGLETFKVQAHRICLLQVMSNLILNAYESIQRNKKASGEISLSASSDVLDDKPMARVTVRDNGTGFSRDTGSKIFARGFTSKASGETNGLGLHWCANAVTSMGGRIFAESPGAGEGAQFHVVLPAVQGA